MHYIIWKSHGERLEERIKDIQSKFRKEREREGGTVENDKE